MSEMKIDDGMIERMKTNTSGKPYTVLLLRPDYLAEAFDKPVLDAETYENVES